MVPPAPIQRVEKWTRGSSPRVTRKMRKSRLHTATTWGQPRVGWRVTCTGRSKASRRSEEHTSELQSLMRISYAVFCLKKKKDRHKNETNPNAIGRVK